MYSTGSHSFSRVHGLRRLLALLMVLALVASGCSGGDDETDTGSGGDDSSATSDDTSGDDGDSGSTTGDDAGSTDDGDNGSSGDDDSDSDDSGTTTGDDGDDGDDEPAEPAGPPGETAGFDGETITLGYLVDQTGVLGSVGNGLLKGSQVYWDWVNSEGGIAGQYPVELEVGDTRDSEAQTVQEYLRIKDDVAMIAQVLSTPPTQALLEFLEEDDMIAVPGSLAGQWANEPLLLPNGTAYEYEMINLADWYVKESGLASPDDTYCVIRTNDKYGEDTVEGVDFAADRLGFTIAEEQTLGRGDTSFTSQVRALKDAGCDVVFSITVVFESHGMLIEALAQGFEPVWLGALPSYLNAFTRGAEAAYEDFYIALDTPNFTDDDVPGIAAFNERWATFGSGDPNTFNLSGYFQSIAIRALLEKAVARGDLSREGLLAAYADLGEVELDGLADNYVYGTPENRIPARAVRIYHFDSDNPPNFLTEVANMDSPLTAEFPL